MLLRKIKERKVSSDYTWHLLLLLVIQALVYRVLPTFATAKSTGP